MGDSPIDSISFTNPGGSDSLTERTSPRREDDPAAVQHRINQLVADVCAAAYSFALERLKTGGVFVQAERFSSTRAAGRPVNRGMELELTRMLREKLGAIADGFEHLGTVAFNPVQRPTDGVAWGSSHEDSGSSAYLAFARWRKK